ncbi:MAG: hypothetical protein ACLTAT_11125 [Lachnospira eligens]
MRLINKFIIIYKGVYKESICNADAYTDMCYIVLYDRQDMEYIYEEQM